MAKAVYTPTRQRVQGGVGKRERERIEHSSAFQGARLLLACSTPVFLLHNLPESRISISILFSFSELAQSSPCASIMAARLASTRLEQATTALFVCDVQEKFVNAIHGFSHMANASAKVIKGANILQVPIFTTEQNPKGA